MRSASELRAHEEKRLAALRATGLIDSPPEEFFDKLTKLATDILHLPVALISLVDEKRQFFKSEAGLPPGAVRERETPLSQSFCQYVAALGEPLVVTDARNMPLVQENLAVRDLNVIAYAGIPLVTEDGYAIGSFCAIDTQPREWSAQELSILRTLADQAMSEITLRNRLRKADQDVASLRENQVGQSRRVRQNVHDLRTPITAMLVSLDGVEMSGPLNEEQRFCWEMAKNSSRELCDLINQLLELNEKKPAVASPRLTFTDCRLHELVESAIDQVAPLAERAGVVIDDSAVAPVDSICGNPRGLKRVFVNLLANAVKFTPRGGRVDVIVLNNSESSALPGNGSGSISASDEDWAVTVTVADNGIGIAPEDQERIFTEGERVDKDAPLGESTGIGLSYCRQVLAEHGGDIAVRSSLGRGSIFTVRLPQKPPESPKS